VEDNPYGGRQFDLGGEPLQAHCPSYILRYDVAELIENATVDCHRQARYLSFEQQFGPLQVHEQIREDRHIYRAVEEACQQMLQMLQTPRPLSEYLPQDGDDGAISSTLIKEIQAERALLQRCQHEFRLRQQELSPRPVPNELAEPLARIRSGESNVGQEQSAFSRAGEDLMPASGEEYGGGYGNAFDDRYPAEAAMGSRTDGFDSSGNSGSSARASAYASAYRSGGLTAASAADYLDGNFDGGDSSVRKPSSGNTGQHSMPSSLFEAGDSVSLGGAGGVGGAGAGGLGGGAGGTGTPFSAGSDRLRVDQLLQRLQQGASLSGI